MKRTKEEVEQEINLLEEELKTADGQRARVIVHDLANLKMIFNYLNGTFK